MKERLQKRLDALKQEMESGQGQLRQLDEQRNSLEQTLLRISGAIQVLEEELKDIDETEGQPQEEKQTVS